MREQIRKNLIRFIENFRSNFDPSKKRKFNGGSNRESYGGQHNLNRNDDIRHNGQNLYRHAPVNGAGGGCGIGSHIGGGRQDGNHGGVGVASRGTGHNTNQPPHQDIQRKRGGNQNFRGGCRLA